MRAFVVKELSHPSKIPVTHGVPEPTLGPRQISVDVYSAGLNFFDVMFSVNQGVTTEHLLDSASTRKVSTHTTTPIYPRYRVRRKSITQFTYTGGLPFQTGG